MIAIKFSPQYEDRVGIYLKNSNLKSLGVKWNFKETPGIDAEHQCFWLIEYKHSKLVNTVLSELKEMKQIMGVLDLQFQYCYSEKEFYTQYSTTGNRCINWFAI
jgi:hypothetical protein